jgi:hypothetical protein
MPAPLPLAPVSRADFNRVAAERMLPLFWIEDTDKNGVIDPNELAVLWGMVDTKEEDWVISGAFTDYFRSAHREIAMRAKTGHDFTGLAPDEMRRRTAVLKELAQGRPTLVASDFRMGSAEDKAVVQHVLAAAKTVERLYAKQLGTASLSLQIPPEDTASRMLFYRNQGPKCEAPATQNDPDCSALPSRFTPISGLYPADWAAQPGFCDKLATRPDAAALFDPFVVVSGKGDALQAVPYTVVYKPEMESVSRELTAAANAIQSPNEGPLKAYLTAAAQALLDNKWAPADEVWAKMGVHNSKWYLRIAPDEVYFEPCNRKAGFHVSFARINQGSIEWQNKLDPVKGDLERAIATLAGPPYSPRDVSFHLPDFIDVVVNAGDSRSAHGATIGQSLPNFGPVANEGRGRTVAMTNFYTDPDSIQSARQLAEAVLCAPSMASYSSDPAPQLMSTVLHEAAHNLGPAHQYKVAGKTDVEVFGGPLASTLEELKAQSAALYFTDWLAGKNVIDKKQADLAHVRDMTWAFGHISRGMYSADKKPEPYSQLSAIQVGFLRKERALSWNPDETAANGKDKGCMSIELQAFPDAARKLMAAVAQIKAKGDVDAARALVAEFVDGKGELQQIMSTITERYLRSPRASFVYSIRL